MVPTADIESDLTRLLLVVSASREALSALRDSAGADDAVAVLPRLGDWLYESWYLVPSIPTLASLGHRTNLSPAYRAALPSSTRWMRGWVAMEAGINGRCVAARRGQARELRCGEYANVSRPGVPVMPGDEVAVIECVDWTDWPTGFWTTRSVSGPPQARMIRLYWSVDEEQICHVLRELTARLEALQLRYSLKCPIRSVDFARVDSLVVYLERTAWLGARDEVAGLAHRLQPLLRHSSPPLTQPIASGVAFAEDPGNNESFGQSRCRILAVGLNTLLREDPLTIPHGMEILTRAMEAANIDPERPWLNPVR